MRQNQKDSREGAAESSTLKKRCRAWLTDNQWIVVGAMAVVTVCLGIIGFKHAYAQSGDKRSVPDLLYLTLQLFALCSGAAAPGPVSWHLELARFMAPALAAYAAIKASMLLFHEKFQLRRLRRMKGHVVICGLGKKGRHLADDFLSRGEKVVIIESNEGNDETETCRERGATVLLGSATSPFLLSKARVIHAKYLFAVCSDDGTNLETALLAHKRMKGAPDRSFVSRRCYVHLVDTELRDLLAQHEAFCEIKEHVEINCFKKPSISWWPCTCSSTARARGPLSIRLMRELTRILLRQS